MGSQILISLTRLTDFLDKLAPADFNSTRVEGFLNQHHLEFDELLPFIYFREDTYGRNIVKRNTHYELLILSWLPNQSTPIHDHNGQRCWIWMHSGKLTFRSFRQLDGKEQSVQPCGPSQVHSPGELTYLDDSMGFHEIANLSGKPAVSLHLYAEPISHCRIYDQQKKKFELVELRAFNPREEEVPEEMPPGGLLS